MSVKLYPVNCTAMHDFFNIIKVANQRKKCVFRSTLISIVSVDDTNSLPQRKLPSITIASAV